jgi:hypothetical protein
MAVTARNILQSRTNDPGVGPRWKTALTLLIMAIAVLAVYFPIQTSPGDNTLLGLDFDQLHMRRLEFAESALFGPHPHLPGWYPRELLGTPFWSNIQDFPLLPTRLILLLFDPLAAYAIGVIMAAELAALFTFIYGQTIGLSRVAAAATGWTFACSGFFASRVMAGHLPLLEVYCALPLMLWLVHRCLISPSGRRRSNALRILGLTTTLICFAGHPQIPAYAITAAAAYAIWMNYRQPRTPQSARTMLILLAMALGVGVAAFVLYPMLLLIGRSSRILPLDPPINDVAFPLSRLLAFVLPWRDGWPKPILRFPRHEPHFANISIFWETVCYIGLLPLVAALFWVIYTLLRRRWPSRPWMFISIAGIVALLLALPAVHSLMLLVPGTIVRSPARLLYFTLFALSFAFGAGIDWLLARSRGKIWLAAAVAGLLLLHGVDLGRHDRYFIRTTPIVDDAQDGQNLEQTVGDGRTAIDDVLLYTFNRQYDDIGYFDSIALAKPYRALLDLGDKPEGWNSQYLDGSDLNPRALEVCAVRFMLTRRQLPGQPTLSSAKTRSVYFPEHANRADFYPLVSTVVADVPTIHERLRDRSYDLLHQLLIPAGSPTPSSSAAPDSLPTTVVYTRDSEDVMTIDAAVPQSGYLRIDEAWDPGWHATVDGKSVPLIAGDDVFLTLPLSSGYHKVRLEFSTPGLAVGCVISVVCLAFLIWTTRDKHRALLHRSNIERRSGGSYTVATRTP